MTRYNWLDDKRRNWSSWYEKHSYFSFCFPWLHFFLDRNLLCLEYFWKAFDDNANHYLHIYFLYFKNSNISIVHYHQVSFPSGRMLAIPYLFDVINERWIYICSHYEPEKQSILRCIIMYNMKKYTASTIKQ